MIISFVRDYERIARFRLGKFEGMKGPGIVIAIPVIHSTEKVDTRVEVLDISRQTNITKDNVPLSIDVLVYLRVDVDNAERSVLEVEDYRYAVRGLATTTMRAVIGDMALDEVLSQRDRINELIRTRLDTETERWGIKVTNVEIREVDPPADVQDAMNQQMNSERERRAAVLQADGIKEAAITVAEGEKQAAILKAEGNRESEILNAQGDQQATVLRAEGYAEALKAIHGVAQGVDANTMTLQYVDALKELGSGDSTKFVLPLELTKMLGALGSFTSNDD
ncbi:MAG: SPFH domain-containing protein [Dehalococcoidia bacterium]|jgi:regulator of protease activity HflC (stomatin/prohibitin superfamily)|nr:SPFH domain-containing protein [Dehalococcoidia bacterium]|tara:strand:+ start:1202 stop:2041 length:840 start_codon:yes stop_codon:yes gene_type:complete